VNVVAVDLNEIGQNCSSVLSSHAAMHKRAVRPRGRRALSAYHPHAIVRHGDDQVSVACVGGRLRTAVLIPSISSLLLSARFYSQFYFFLYSHLLRLFISVHGTA